MFCTGGEVSVSEEGEKRKGRREVAIVVRSLKIAREVSAASPSSTVSSTTPRTQSPPAQLTSSSTLSLPTNLVTPTPPPSAIPLLRSRISCTAVQAAIVVVGLERWGRRRG